MNHPHFPTYRPVSQAGQTNMVNKSMNNAHLKTPMGMSGMSEGSSNSNVNQSMNTNYTQNKLNGGFPSFGRYS